MPGAEPSSAVRTKTVREKASPKPVIPAETQTGKVRKLDINCDRITLPISPDLRDKVDTLARELQRHRTKRGESITANAVIRQAVQLIVSRVHLTAEDVANTEEELYELIERKVRGR